MKREIKYPGIVYRTSVMDRDAVKGDERTVELSFSSELPVEQYGWEGRYLEVLDHQPESVDMSRLLNGAPLLLEHNRSAQIGVIESAEIRDKRGYAKVRFGNSERANEIFQDVKDGIRRLVSVGYRVSKLVTEKIENEVETLRAVGWQPMEISIVSIPADTSVGIGRKDQTGTTPTIIPIEDPMKLRSQVLLDHAPAPGGGGTPPAPAPAPAPVGPTRADIANEFNEMYALCKRHNKSDIYELGLKEGWSIERMRGELLKALETPAIIGRAVNDASAPDDRTRDGQRQVLTVGERLVSSEQFRAAASSRSKSKAIVLELNDVLGFRGVSDIQTRATLLTTGLTSYQRPPGIVELGQQPLTIAQLFSQGETSASVIRAFVETSYTQAATAVAEEGEKPEATFALEERDFPVKKIAVIGRISDEMLSDYPAVRDYINSRLGYMVQSLEDSELLNGTGASNRITGVLQTSGIQNEAYAGNGFDAIDRGLQKVRAVGFFEPDAIVMHPSDAGNFRRTKDSNGQYYGGGPYTGPYGVGGYSVAGFMWGKPIIETTAIAQGTALIGAFRLGGQVFRRMGLTMEMTNSDGSDFKFNRIAIRAEERLALAVYRPLAFCTITGIPNA